MPAELTRICALDDVGEEEILRVNLDGYEPISVTRVDDDVHVFPDTCPHAEESLSEGWIEDGRVVCGVHFAEFDLGTGQAHEQPTGCGNLRFFPSDVTDGEVFADLSQAHKR